VRRAGVQRWGILARPVKVCQEFVMECPPAKERIGGIGSTSPSPRFEQRKTATIFLEEHDESGSPL
jgi:hypothetical protein